MVTLKIEFCYPITNESIVNLEKKSYNMIKKATRNF